MATLTVVVWLVAIAIFIWIVRALYIRTNNNNAVILFGTGSVFGTFAVTAGLLQDIYGIDVLDGQPLSILTWWIEPLLMGIAMAPGISRSTVLLISGLVALGLTSTTSLLFNSVNLQSSPPHVQLSQWVRATGFLVALISLVSAILGIIGFYLDHLQ